MELNILRADPAGNITVFVLDPVEKAQRAAIAEKIMAIPALKAEQVGYACVAEDDVDGHMEMMGRRILWQRDARLRHVYCPAKGRPFLGQAARERLRPCRHRAGRSEIRHGAR